MYHCDLCSFIILRSWYYNTSILRLRLREDWTQDWALVRDHFLFWFSGFHQFAPWYRRGRYKIQVSIRAEHTAIEGHMRRWAGMYDPWGLWVPMWITRVGDETSIVSVVSGKVLLCVGRDKSCMFRWSLDAMLGFFTIQEGGSRGLELTRLSSHCHPLLFLKDITPY